MVQLICSLCHDDVGEQLNELRDHLINFHGLTITQGIEGRFRCGQNGCDSQFFNFFSFRKHIKRTHFRNQDNDEELEVDVDNFNVDNDNNVYNDNNYNNINDNNCDDDDNNINNINNNNNNNNEFNMRKYIIQMVARFQCKASMTTTTLTEVLDEFEELLINTSEFLKKKVSDFFVEEGLINNDRAKNILSAFNFDGMFTGLKTLDNQIAALEAHFGYIHPVEIPLGYRIDQKLDRSSDILEAILAEQKSPNGILGSFLDGEHAQNHEFFLQYPNTLRLQLYYDEFEIVNPLGSKTGIHKLGAFYYTIQNLPPHINSDLNSIHVLLLCCDADVKKYGFSQILRPFLNDLALLESDDGVLTELESGNFILRASIAAFCGDGLAVHDVFNLLGPSANQFCRMCMYSRADLRVGTLELGQERSEELFQVHLDSLKASNYSDEVKTQTGVRGDCCLNESKYFHISRNKIFDPMHDFLCGICPMILKLVLKHYIIDQQKFDVKIFNGTISSFQWGYCEMKNKPSSNFTDNMLRKKDHTLSQRAMQTWTLTRALPFLLADEIDSDDEHMSFVLNLLQIMELVFAPKITNSLKSIMINIHSDD
ncbi:uncharacterized protein LOC141533631 isoform X2 [Cotesia typhae]|uniref:uncharacterized protein LOC141533631 isoform X2 n=1 Tax=Cotesia typhae TaxID=2053667 RepID=UPI003D68671C